MRQFFKVGGLVFFLAMYTQSAFGSLNGMNEFYKDIAEAAAAGNIPLLESCLLKSLNQKKIDQLKTLVTEIAVQSSLSDEVRRQVVQALLGKTGKIELTASQSLGQITDPVMIKILINNHVKSAAQGIKVFKHIPQAHQMVILGDVREIYGLVSKTMNESVGFADVLDQHNRTTMAVLMCLEEVGEIHPDVAKVIRALAGSKDIRACGAIFRAYLTKVRALNRSVGYNPTTQLGQIGNRNSRKFNRIMQHGNYWQN